MDTIKNGLPGVPERIAGLGELAYNHWWSWHPAAGTLFKLLDRQAWKASGHNPVKMLRELPGKIPESAASDADYLHHYDVALSRFQKEMSSKGGWFPENTPGAGSHIITSGTRGTPTSSTPSWRKKWRLSFTAWTRTASPATG